jgi:hypothetical protein
VWGGVAQAAPSGLQKPPAPRAERPPGASAPPARPPPARRQSDDLAPASLAEGVPYYVTVVATNRAGPRLSSNVSSAPFVVDTSPPAGAAVYNT